MELGANNSNIVTLWASCKKKKIIILKSVVIC